MQEGGSQRVAAPVRCQAAKLQVVGSEVQAVDEAPKLAVELLQVQPAYQVSVLFWTAPM